MWNAFELAQVRRDEQGILCQRLRSDPGVVRTDRFACEFEIGAHTRIFPHCAVIRIKNAVDAIVKLLHARSRSAVIAARPRGLLKSEPQLRRHDEW